MASLLVALLLWSCSVWGNPASYYTGNELVSRCDSSALRQNVCLGYLAGLADSIHYNPKKHQVCFPENYTLVQMQKLWVNWASHSPDRLHLPAYNLVMEALAEAWTCLDGVPSS